MRPTDLHFRSPREKTGEFLYPELTSYGRRLSILHKKRIKGTFSLSHRFPEYQELAKKTGHRVGPGAYEQNQKSIGKIPIKGTPIYHPAHGSNDLGNNGYIYVGNSIVFDPGLLNKSAASVNGTECVVDATQVIKSTPKCRSGKSFNETSESFRKVPWFLKTISSEKQTATKSFFQLKYKRQEMNKTSVKLKNKEDR